MPETPNTPVDQTNSYISPSKEDIDDLAVNVSNLTAKVRLGRRAVRLMALAIAILLLIIIGFGIFYGKYISDLHKGSKRNHDIIVNIQNQEQQIHGLLQFVAQSQNPKSSLSKQSAANTKKILGKFEECEVNAIAVDFFHGTQDPSCPIITLYTKS